MKTKAMISQPMAGLTEEQIVETRDRAVQHLESTGHEVINTLFTDEWYSKGKMESRGVVQIPVCFLAKSLENMSLCHTVYFAKGWEKARGCIVEHGVALAYGLEVIYERTIELGEKRMGTETKYLSEQFERIVIESEEDGEPVAVITSSDIEPAPGYVARCKPKA